MASIEKKTNVKKERGAKSAAEKAAPGSADAQLAPAKPKKKSGLKSAKTWPFPTGPRP